MTLIGKDLTLSDLLFFLEKIDMDFTPPLSSVQPLEKYATKLLDKAQCEVIWHNDVLVGLNCFYINEEEGFAYLTILALEKEYRGKGYSKLLLNNMVKKLISYPSVNEVRLEVHLDNQTAINLYNRLGFNAAKTVHLNPSKIYLVKNLKKV